MLRFLLDGLAVAEAARDVWRLSEVPFVLRLLFNDDLKGVELHKPTLLHPVTRPKLP
jgi:hypothetical protein